MRTRLVLQPFADDLALVEVLTEAAANPAFDRLAIAVAWARPSGLLHLEDAVGLMRARGGTSRIIVGIDEGGATVEGLQMVVELFDKANVLHDPTGGTFHPKIYIFRGDHEALAIIGSNNLTAGGLYFNFEAAHVCALDLALSADLAILEQLEDYMQRLLEDDTCLELTMELIGQIAVNPRYRIGFEAHRRGRSDSNAHDENESNFPGIFRPTRYARKAVAKTVVARTSRNSTRSADQIVTTSAEAGGSTAAVAARWTKRLTRSDCGQPREGSNTTGALRFTKAGHPIDQANWFRRVLFEGGDWVDDPSRPGRERCDIRFDVDIYGNKLGTHVLGLKFDAQREAGQNNFTTDLKWGSMAPAIRSQDLVGSYVTVEVLVDDTFRMRIESDEPEPFLDQLSS